MPRFSLVALTFLIFAQTAVAQDDGTVLGTRQTEPTLNERPCPGASLRNFPRTIGVDGKCPAWWG